MAIDHEAHKIRIKAVSDKMNHPMEYNDAGAPKADWRTPRAESYEQENQRREEAEGKTAKGRAEQRKRGLRMR